MSGERNSYHAWQKETVAAAAIVFLLPIRGPAARGFSGFTFLVELHCMAD